MTRTEHVLRALGVEILERRGARGWALCPYHEDRSATNFFVRLKGDRSGQNHCFACKRGGGLTSLVMHVRGLSEEAARAFIAALGKNFEPQRVRARVVEREVDGRRRRFEMPREVAFEPLDRWVTPARAYAEGRGITADEVERFRMGYAVDGRLAGRIVIPWVAESGRVAGYSARTFVDDEPKYLTPRGADLADRAVMVGEHLWPPRRERDLVAVTEGALNGAAIQRVEPAVPFGALGGSEIEAAHALKLSTFRRVLILTDPDKAGDSAAAKLERLLARYARTARVVLPRGTDALDLATSGRGELLSAAMRRAAAELGAP